MSRFFCENLVPSPRLSEPDAAWQEVDPYRVELSGDEAKHARRVLRLDIGDAVELFNGAGLAARGVIEAWQPRAVVRVDAMKAFPQPRPRLILAACMPKGSHADQIVAQLSQLGVDTFIPLLTERSIVDPREAKIDRLRRACVESAKQCGRSWVMQVESPADFADVLATKADARLIADVATGSTPPSLAATDAALILIGPEGGWTDAERDSAHAAGFSPWVLGPHVMRIETAAAAAAAIWSYHCKQSPSTHVT